MKIESICCKVLSKDSRGPVSWLALIGSLLRGLHEIRELFSSNLYIAQWNCFPCKANPNRFK